MYGLAKWRGRSKALGSSLFECIDFRKKEFACVLCICSQIYGRLLVMDYITSPIIFRGTEWDLHIGNYPYTTKTRKGQCISREGFKRHKLGEFSASCLRVGLEVTLWEGGIFLGPFLHPYSLKGHKSYSLNSLNGDYVGDYTGEYCRDD